MYFDLYDIDTTAFRYIWASIDEVTTSTRPPFGQMWPR